MISFLSAIVPKCERISCTISFQPTHVKIAGGLTKSDLKQAKELGAAWYRSKERVPIKHNFVGDGWIPEQ